MGDPFDRSFENAVSMWVTNEEYRLLLLWQQLSEADREKFFREMEAYTVPS